MSSPKVALMINCPADSILFMPLVRAIKTGGYLCKWNDISILDLAWLGNTNKIVKLKITVKDETRSTISAAPHSVSGYQSQLRAVLQEDAACILLGVDPDTVVSDDGAGITTVSVYQELVLLIIVMLRP